MRKVFLATALCAGLGLSTAEAHGPPTMPAEPGPMPDVLFEHPVFVFFPGQAAMPMHFKADKTVSFVELDLEDMEQSVGGKGAWTWDDESLCIYSGDAVVCFGLDNVVTPGKSYNSTFRILDVQGQELDAMPMKVMLVR